MLLSVALFVHKHLITKADIKLHVHVAWRHRMISFGVFPYLCAYYIDQPIIRYLLHLCKASFIRQCLHIRMEWVLRSKFWFGNSSTSLHVHVIFVSEHGLSLLENPISTKFLFAGSYINCLRNAIITVS